MARSIERLVATVRHRYGGRWIEPGQSFEVPANAVTAFLRNHWAKRQEAPPVPAPEPKPAPKSGTYSRRDMEAEKPSQGTTAKKVETKEPLSTENTAALIPSFVPSSDKAE